MRGLIAKRGAGLFGLLALTGCGIAGPIMDPGLNRAPRLACAEVTPPPEAGPQCFRFERRAIGGGRLEMNDGALDAETEILAFATGAAGCSGGDHSFATVAGAAGEAGAVSVLAFGGTGAQIGQDYAWDAPFAARVFRLRGVGGPFINANGIRIRSSTGQFRLSRVCFADYWRLHAL